MNSRTVDKIRHALNTDVVRRMLIRYFVDKGFTETFDRVMYPGLVQDLVIACPILTSKVEVIPHCIEIDTVGQRAVLGWNMFVLGTQRMYLGETHHRDLADLARQIQSGMIAPTQGGMMMPIEGIPHGVARRQVTPRHVIIFLTRVLGRHESGYVDLTPPKQSSMTSMAYGFGATRSGMMSGGIASYGGL